MRKFLRKHRRGALYASVPTGLGIIGLVVALLLPSAVPTPVTAAPASSPTPASCEGFELKLDPNTNGRVVSASIRGNAEGSVEKMLTATRHDWRPFQSFWNDSPLGNGKSALSTASAKKLFSEGCMTAEGQAMWHQLAGAMRSAKKVEIIKVGNRVVGNTYADVNGTTVKRERLTGDTTATKITFRDGSTTTVLHRCGNVVTAAPPPPPEGKQESQSHVNDGFQDEAGHNVRPPPDANPIPADDEMPQPTATGGSTGASSPSPSPSPSPTSEPDPDPCGPRGCASPTPSPTPSPTATSTYSEPPPED